MTTHQRFVLDENRNVIDTLDPTDRKGYCHEGDSEDQAHLRDCILVVRLSDLVDGLITREFNRDSHAIWRAIISVIRASRLNMTNSGNIENKSNETLKRKESGLHQITSLSLFFDDVKRLLRDLYGDNDSEGLEQVSRAVFVVAEEFLRYVRKDLWQEHQDAWAWDYIRGIGVPEGYGISGSDHRCGMRAIHDLELRARLVSENPFAFSRYTLEFIKLWRENTAPASAENLMEAGIGITLAGHDETEEVPF
jgi:hypothetical protein